MPHKKILGMPPLALGGIIIAGILLGLYLRHRASSSSSLAPGAAGTPIDAATLGNLTNAAAGGGVAPVSGLDPVLEGALVSNQDALVNQTNYLTALLGSNVASSQGLASSVVDDAFAFANHFLDTVPVYTYGSSPAGSSPVGTTTAPVNTPPVAPPSSPPPSSPPALPPSSTVHLPTVYVPGTIPQPGKVYVA